MPPVARSYLYVPGDREDLLDGASSRGADAVVVDLEDAVVHSRKRLARDLARAWLDAARTSVVGTELWVRVDATSLDDDLAAVVVPGLTGVFVPKAEPAMLHRVDEVIHACERRVGLAPGTTRVLALVETARGVLHAEEVAGSPRVVRLGMGEADLVGELGLRPGPDRLELAPLRSMVVLASASQGLLPPVGPVELALRDPTVLAESTQLLLRQGFRARTALTPRQLDVVNAVFTPSDAEVARARRVLGLLEASRTAGSGVTVDEDGRFIDAATARSALEVVSRAR